MPSPSIHDLALELLQEIFLLIPYKTAPSSKNDHLRERTDRYRTLADFRTICRTFDGAVQPLLFSEMTVDCLYTRLPIIRNQLSALRNDGSGPWRQHTRVLNLVNLGPYYDRRPSGGGIKYWKEYLNQEQQKIAQDMEELIANDLIGSLTDSLASLETLRWFVRPGDPINDITSHFGKVKTLQSLTLVFWESAVLQDFPINAFSNLTNIRLYYHLDDVPYDGTGGHTEAGGSDKRWERALATCRCLKTLHIEQRHGSMRWKDGIHPFPVDSSSPALRHLEHLSLTKLNLADANDDAPPYAYYRQLCSNMISLTSVELVDCWDSTSEAFWSGIMSTSVLLSSIIVDYIPPPLKHYLLRPEVPLENLTIIVSYWSMFDLEPEEYDALAREIYTTVLEIHSGSLKSLDIRAKHMPTWWVEVDSEQSDTASTSPSSLLRQPIYLEKSSLFRCEGLRSLALFLDPRREMDEFGRIVVNPEGLQCKMSKFLRELTRLPNLRQLTVYSKEDLVTAQIFRDAIEELRVSEDKHRDFGFDIHFQDTIYQLTAPIYDPAGPNDRSWRYQNPNADFEDYRPGALADEEVAEWLGVIDTDLNDDEEPEETDDN